MVLRDGSAMNAFSVSQRDALALLSLNLSRQAFDIYLVFFGLWLSLIGYLIVRWLLIVGLNPRRWLQQAGAPGP